MTVAEDKIISEQVERILRSEELRTSEVLRRLLKFLAEKSASGEADELKEYIVAIDGMGKPASYDPRHDSAVRIQVGRLRQKLADYYRAEGSEDPIIIDVPKGRFKLHYEFRQETSPPVNGAAALESQALPPISTETPAEPPAIALGTQWRRILVASVAALVLIAACISLWVWNGQSRGTHTLAGFTPELQELWQPFLVSKRPLIMAVEDPLFAEVHIGSGIYIRDKNVDSWKDVPDSTAISAIHRVVKNADVEPSRYYTSFGQVDISFMIGKLLGPQIENLRVWRVSEFSWQQMADNNVLFIGIPTESFGTLIQPMPIAMQLIPGKDGVHNLHPQPGEPEMYLNKYVTSPEEEGIAYALVTHVPGPVGANDIESFTSRRSAGYIAAVKAFSDPNSARLIVENLKKVSGGHVPRYFQVLFRVQFKNEVPIGTTLVLARELHQ